ncbi:MAG: tail fiber protein [Pseudomonadota bacterium]
MKRLLMAAAAAASLAAGLQAAPASAQQDNFIGEVRIFPYPSFCPRSWTPAHGQLLSIAQNTALFSLYGTTFGGDGRSTFGVPDLRGRAPMGEGRGPGLTARIQGQKFGSEQVTLTVAQMPAHNHYVRASSAGANSASFANAGWGSFGSAFAAYRSGGTLDQQANSSALSMAGGDQPHFNMQPSLVLRYCVATEGLYPSRS